MQIEVRIVDSSIIISQLNKISVRFDLYNKIKEAQRVDSQMEKIRGKVQRGELKEFSIEENVLKLGHRLCVPDVAEIKKVIMKEAHCTPYTTHTENTKNVTRSTI